VRPEGIHVTLKFLGAVAEERVPAINTALRLGVRDAAPFAIQPSGFGSFHGGRHTPYEFRGRREIYHYNLRALWMGVEGDVEALSSLAGRVEAALNPLGFPTEKRAFQAHLTLARMQDRAERDERIAAYEALEPYLSLSTRSGRFDPDLVPAFPPIPVRRVSLMRSTLQRGGAVYDALQTFPLEGGA
jgi:2'-5' RNA ligase